MTRDPNETCGVAGGQGRESGTLVTDALMCFALLCICAGLLWAVWGRG